MRKDTLKQQLHKKCGGEIVAVSDKTKKLLLACKKCALNWTPTRVISTPDEFKSVTNGQIINANR